jgi:hypothetical protein
MTVSTQHSAFSQTEIQEVRHGEEQDSCHESTRINTNWKKQKANKGALSNQHSAFSQTEIQAGGTEKNKIFATNQRESTRIGKSKKPTKEHSAISTQHSAKPRSKQAARRRARFLPRINANQHEF